MARANRNLQGVGYRAIQTIFYDHTADYFPGVVKLYQSNAAHLQERLKSVTELVPEHKVETEAFAKRADAIVALTDEAVKLGSEGKDEEAREPMGKADATGRATGRGYQGVDSTNT